jgi:hypothetical protein
MEAHSCITEWIVQNTRIKQNRLKCKRITPSTFSIEDARVKSFLAGAGELVLKDISIQNVISYKNDWLLGT